jgi:O-antigen ligase
MAGALEAIADATPALPARWRSAGAIIGGCLLLAAGSLWLIAGANTRIVVVLAVSGAAYGIVRGAIYAWRHESWLIFALTLLILLLSTAVLDNPGARAAIHYGIAMLLCLPMIPRVLRSGILRQGGFRLYTLYFLWGLFTISYSLAPVFSVSRLADSIMMFTAITCCVSQVDDETRALKLVWRAMLGAAVIVALVVVFGLFGPHSLNWLSPEDTIDPAILQEMRQLGLQVGGIERFRGILNGPNDVGVLLLLTVGPALVCWRSADRRNKWLLAALIAGSLGACAAADSRSPMIGLTVGAILYCIWRYRAKSMLAIGAGLALAIAAAFLMGHQFSAYVDRGNVTTLTGRTEMWQFVIGAIFRHPIRGYGYEVGGAVLDSPYFPLWWGPWDQGPHSSLHDGYLNHAVGVGIPATLFWLFIMLRPWFSIFRLPGDPWRLKSMFFLIAIPLLILNLTEAAVGDCIEASGFLFGVVWALAERHRLLHLEAEAARTRQALATMSRPMAALVG